VVYVKKRERDHGINALFIARNSLTPPPPTRLHDSVAQLHNVKGDMFIFFVCASMHGPNERCKQKLTEMHLQPTNKLLGMHVGNKSILKQN
jgi:hypothetical protein